MSAFDLQQDLGLASGAKKGAVLFLVNAQVVLLVSYVERQPVIHIL
jgi:hypothetical protein